MESENRTGVWPDRGMVVTPNRVSIMMGVLKDYVEPIKTGRKKSSPKFDKETVNRINATIIANPKMTVIKLSALLGIHSTTVDRYKLRLKRSNKL